MSYSGSCLCSNVKFSFEFDPMMQFQCHCTTCQKVFGTSLNALAMPEAELSHEGEMLRYTITGGSGSSLHYNYCPICSVIIYNKPDLLALIGPNLISVSAPLIKSYKSLIKFVPIWIRIAAIKVNKATKGLLNLSSW